MAEPLVLPELTAALCFDQRERWQHGERIPAEAYLERYPELKADTESAADLVYHEVVLREERDEHPRLEEYRWRFPHLQEELRKAFEIHEALERGPLRDANGTVPPQRTMPYEEAAAPRGTGPTVPGYEILGEIGRGGMGVVYKARQLSLNRLVALKVILAGAHAGPEHLARFRAGAEACARLHDPHIVEVYDVGEHAGQPHLAMELVDGLSLAEHLAGTPLAPRDAVTLLETLAGTIHVAHQHGVVHRDLKPANVLLAFSREPVASAEPALATGSRLNEFAAKITDFGLAKQLDAHEGLTPTEAILGTPSYMAPEQAAGDSKAVGPAADVYALGAILYELLTGRPPFKAATVLETLEQVRSLEPVPVRRLQPKVPRDLETICLKCLRKEPARRYASAAALADDARRFLNGEPIMARPVPRIERLWRWCQRNQRVAGLLLTLTLVVSGSLVGLAWLWWLARDHAAQALRLRTRADENVALAAPLAASYGNFLLERRAAGASKKARDDLLQFCLLQERLVEEQPHDLTHRRNLGKTYGHLGVLHADNHEFVEAERWYQRAIAFLEECLRQHSTDTEFRRELASTLANHGNVQAESGQQEAARVSYHRGRDLLEPLVRDHPDNLQFQRDLATNLNNTGTILTEPAASLHAYEQARTLRAKQVDRRPDDADARHQLASSLNNIALALESLNRRAEALETFQQAVTHQRVACDRAPHVVEFQKQLSQYDHNLASRLGQLGRPAEALPYCHEACRLLEKLVGDQGGHRAHQRSLYASLDLLGMLEADTGRPAESLRTHQKARVLLLSLVGPKPSVKEDKALLAKHSLHLGTALERNQRDNEASVVYQQAITLFQELHRDYPPDLGFQRDLSTSYFNLATLFQKTGKLDEAVRALDQAILHERRTESPLPPSRQRLTNHYFKLAEIERHRERPAAAVAAIREVEVLWPTNPGVLYRAASERAQCLVLVGAERHKDADLVMETLRRAVQHGYADAESLRTDPTLNAVRSRADFHSLLAEVAAKPRD